MLFTNKRIRLLLSYDFSKTIERNGRVDDVSYSFVMHTMNDLINDKYITKKKIGRKNVYSLTEKGKDMMNFVKSMRDYIDVPKPRTNVLKIKTTEISKPIKKVK